MKYTIHARGIIYYETEIEADSLEQANEIAHTLDFEEFIAVDGEFYVDEIEDEDGNVEEV